MKRLLALLMVMVLVLGFAACGDEGKTKSSEKENQSGASSGDDEKTTAGDENQNDEEQANQEQGDEQNKEDAADDKVVETRVLRVGMECAYAPSNWQESEKTDSNLPIENAQGFYAEGYDVQISKMIGESLDADIVIVKLAWGGLIEALNSGQIDLIVAGMADTSERKESINFSDRYGIREPEYGIMLQKTSKYAGAKTLADLSGASVLGQKDTFFDTVIDQIPGVDHLSPVNGIPNMLTRLVEGTTDAIVVDVETAAPFLNTYPQLSLVRFEKGSGFTLDFTGSCIGIRKTDDELMKEVNAALAKIDSETREKLMSTAEANVPQ